MIKVLATGGAGFIGSHTVDLLISKGHKVIVLDNLSTGNKENINKKAKFIFADILNVDKYLKKLRGTDFVIHCAAQISVNNSIKNPINDAKINIIGSLKLLEMCRKLGIKKFVFASSCAVYGLNPPLPASEKNSAIPQNPYAVSKRSVENYMKFYNKTYGIDCISLRYSNAYGPRQNYLSEAGVVTIFINKLLRNQKPTIFGGGKQTRDFVYVDDVAVANVKAIEGKNCSKEINIGTGTQTSINELLSNIKFLINKNKIKPIYKGSKKGEVRFSSLNIELAKKELGWKPKVSLQDGLKRTIEWFKTQI